MYGLFIPHAPPMIQLCIFYKIVHISTSIVLSYSIYKILQDIYSKGITKYHNNKIIRLPFELNEM